MHPTFLNFIFNLTPSSIADQTLVVSIIGNGDPVPYSNWFSVQKNGWVNDFDPPIPITRPRVRLHAHRPNGPISTKSGRFSAAQRFPANYSSAQTEY